eukprot:CAMPEP_0202964812 /NCGR_PEP_ID=MMETSP1396-20130829/8908_1 /ASSEMBLY_ACC=CAM_ASM_000872 /TAXON_ID= /ORGANISM="Pseudokeronopsis sp., Strain Brazil" /LENGTH=56 /DNA_ID=CAMNT_0049687197 /DNA_START=479 /DNA_END=646 /DNA_ORIENTATION=+
MQSLLGAALYGCGWGYGGLALGPGIASLLIYPAMVLWFIAVLLGIYMAGLIEKEMG